MQQPQPSQPVTISPLRWLLVELSGGIVMALIFGAIALLHTLGQALAI